MIITRAKLYRMELTIILISMLLVVLISAWLPYFFGTETLATGV